MKRTVSSNLIIMALIPLLFFSIFGHRKRSRLRHIYMSLITNTSLDVEHRQQLWQEMQK